MGWEEDVYVCTHTKHMLYAVSQEVWETCWREGEVMEISQGRGSFEKE